MKNPQALAAASSVKTSDQHYVRLYGDDHAGLASDVGRFLAASLLAGGAAVSVATEAHNVAFLEELATVVDVDRAQEAGQLACLDAQEMLAKFMVRGYPDAVRFEAAIGGLIGEMTDRYDSVNAYGEMVGVLWASKQYPAAVRIEQLWGQLRRKTAFNLYCGYPIDVFRPGFEHSDVDALLAAHTHLLPARESEALGAAMGRAVKSVLGLETEELQRRVNEAQRLSKASALPMSEATMLWLLRYHPEQAQAVLAQARDYCELSA